ncbi:MAG: sigma-70 family RNA polymerase sigma factor [Lonepinella koalarum]|nr:sigma-70 family RNA polymerase sigma factor [Lonepinella koalarum]
MSDFSLDILSPKQIDEIRLQMVKFALLHLKDPDLAEDVVQDSFMNAYKYADSFKGQSAFKTWVFAILKNKIIDLMRDKKKWVMESELVFEERDISAQLFEQKGTWNTDAFMPKEWHGVEQAALQKQFWQVFDFCLNQLPSNQAQVFMMKIYLELDSDFICQECGLSVANLHTLLYRARLQLQVCLSQKWFGG